jgi:hypothetical protein
MKKLIAIFAVLLFAVPAMAAEWSFYGSQRVATFYVDEDYGKFEMGQTYNPATGTLAGGNGEKDDWGLQWQFQGNSRLGARAKADKVSGHIELALTAANGGDGGDGGVNTRRAYGIWKFADNAALKVGKDYSPVSNLISGQVFDADAGLLGQGDFYGRRPAGLTLILGGFELALLNNALKDASMGGVYDITPAGTDLDWNIPKIEARYTLKLDKFEFIPFGGFQYFKVSDNQRILQDDLDIYSYVGGAVAKVNIGAVYFALEGAYGQNWANANWYDGRSTGARGRIAGFNAAAANLKSNQKDVSDSTSWMVLGLVGLKFTDTLKFELGSGFREDDADIKGLDALQGWESYLQAVVTMAPGVYLIPEVGYIDYMELDNKDLGYAWYAGAKWQIDF